MINTDEIIIIYHDDPDGWTSARLWFKFLRDHFNEFSETYPNISFNSSQIRFHYTNYGRELPDVTGKFVILVDFSVQPIEQFVKFVSKCAHLIWIDHHKTAISMMKKSPSLFKSENVEYYVKDGDKAACELCWEYIPSTRTTPIPLWLHLISKYDVWKMDMEDYHFYLISYMNNHSRRVKNPTDDEIWKNIEEITSNKKLKKSRAIKEGKILFMNFIKKSHSDLTSVGFAKKKWGYKVYFVNAKGMNSIPFERHDEVSQYDIWAPFFYDGQSNKWVVSLYSKKVDVSEIAERYGGGGHSGASGFQLSNEDFFKIILS